MTFSRLNVDVGMRVVDRDQAAVGEVTQVRDTDFVVRDPERGDAIVPCDDIQAIMGRQIVLKLREAELHRQPPG